MGCHRGGLARELQPGVHELEVEADQGAPLLEGVVEGLLDDAEAAAHQVQGVVGVIVQQDGDDPGEDEQDEGEDDEEGQLEQGPVDALGVVTEFVYLSGQNFFVLLVVVVGVGHELVAPVDVVREVFEGGLPGVLEEGQTAGDALPVADVPEGVGDGVGVSAAHDVLAW